MRPTRIPYPHRRRRRRSPHRGAISLLLLLVLAAGFIIYRRSHTTSTPPLANQIVKRTLGNSQPEKFRVGIQAGHWKNDQLPSELNSLQWDFGTSADGINEVDVNLDIAQRVADQLRQQGIEVDVLPAALPEHYQADAFVAIHVDGNEDDSVSGFKIAASSWDESSKSERLAGDIRESYELATGLRKDPAISPDMTEYYAFNYQKFQHAITATTPGVIVEAGYLTNTGDHRIIIDNPDIAAQGISKGIATYLKQILR